MLRYYHERGVALENPPGGYRLQSGIEVVERHSNGRSRFEPGTAVIVAWQSATHYPLYERGHRLVDQDAIEKVDRWKVSSRYQPRHTKDPDLLPFRAEEMAIQHLIASGIRAEKSTPFEDENLGVDFWVLVRAHTVWCWLPVDVSLEVGLRSGMGVNGSRKRVEGFKRGTIPVYLEAAKARENSPKIAEAIIQRLWVMYRVFWRQGVQTLSRHEAQRREILTYG